MAGAWVGLTRFVLGDLRTPVAPAPPWFSRFPETNVRTYVVGPDGREGPLVRYRSRRRRWQLYTRIGPVLARAGVEHEPWPCTGRWSGSRTAP